MYKLSYGAYHKALGIYIAIWLNESRKPWGLKLKQNILNNNQKSRRIRMVKGGRRKR